MFDASVYTARRDALRSKVKGGVILLPGHVDSPINNAANCYRFRQDSNFAYYFGIYKPGMVGVIDEGGRSIIYGDDVSLDDIVWTGPVPTVREQAEEVGVKTTRPLRDLPADLQVAIRKGQRMHIAPPYRAETVLQLSEWLGLMPAHVRNYASEELIAAIISMREVKSAGEVEELDRIAEVGYEMQTAAMRMAQPGEQENTIFGVLEGIAATGGNLTSFGSIISQHGETLHNDKHFDILREGRLLLVDCGVEAYSNYVTDNTRTIPVGGSFTPQQLDMYNLVLQAQEYGIAHSKPGVRYLDVHLGVCGVIVEGLRAMGLVRGDVKEAVELGVQGLFFPHGLGHMMGLDCHDMESLGETLVGYSRDVARSKQFGLSALRCAKELKEGFVVTVEPGIYFIPELIDQWKAQGVMKGFINYEEVEKYRNFGGIRLEDDIVITAEGCRIIGKKRIPIAPADVTAEVQKGRFAGKK